MSPGHDESGSISRARRRRRSSATKTRPIPSSRPGEALVRVRACALNHLDLWNRRGVERVRFALPHISGADVAGEIVESSDGSMAPGRRVMLQPGLSCGRCEACLDGRDNECPRYDVLGSQSDGGYAELVRVPRAEPHRRFPTRSASSKPRRFR